MIDKNISISYKEYSSVGELSAEDRALVEAAIQAQKTSYAP